VNFQLPYYVVLQTRRDVMKGLKEYKKALLPLVSAAALMTLAGCYEERPYYGGQPPPPVAEGYAYYYYPDEEVYFYPATGVYFWSGAVDGTRADMCHATSNCIIAWTCD